MAPFPRLLHHGPFPAPAALSAALATLRAKRDADPDEVAEAEAALVAATVAVQRDIGAPAPADGGGIEGFLAGLAGVEAAGERLLAVERPRFDAAHPWLARAARLAALAPGAGMIALPGPALWAMAAGRDAPEALAEPEARHAALAEAFAAAVAALAKAGAAHVVIDGLAAAPDGGPAPRPREGLALLAEALAARPDGLGVTLAISRAAFASLTEAAGDPEAAAEALAAVPADALMLPFRESADRTVLSALAGAPRRILLGAVETEGRAPRRPDLDAPRRAVDEAARRVDLGLLGLCPEAPFAIDGAGAEDDSKRRLEQLVRAAETIWGGVAG